MERFCDLHTHSVFSDGTCTPAEILREAAGLGLAAVALCDHNTVDGLPDFLSAAAGQAVEAVAGAEFSVDLEGTELHLLALYLPERAFPQVSALMLAVNRRKEESNIALVESLNRAGYRIDYGAIKGKTPNGKVNRAHIGAELTEKGYTASIREAFDTLLAPDRGHYREPERLSVWETLDFILSVGAVPVLAHPFLNLTEERLAEFLPRAKAAGLAGMECQYSLYDAARTERSLQLAGKFGLLPSGGSDFHGKNKPDIRLGAGRGDLAIPYGWAAELKKRAE